MLLLAACSASSGADTASQGTAPSAAAPTHQVTPQPVETPTPVPTPTPLVCAATEHVSLDACVANTPAPTPIPVTYTKLTARAWQLLVKAPDNYTGKGYQVWACITQFDAATGTDSFRAQASYANITYWYSDGDNALFSGDETALADFVESDLVFMHVVSLGSFSYDTQNGGNTTVPLFEVDTIARKGSCD